MGCEQSTRICKLSVGPDGIGRLHYAPNAELTLKDAREVIAAYDTMRQDKRLPLLIDASKMRSFSRESRLHFTSDEVANSISACGIIVGTPVSKVLGNFYLGLSNPKLPSRLFTSEDEALAWLKRFVS